MDLDSTIDRMSLRTRPGGAHVMEQTWDDLVFLHWPIDAAMLRPLIPAQLDIDTFEGQAWIGITPFQVNHVKILSLPELPGLDSFIELNVRTYVHYRGLPGIWFFSLDASKTIPTIAARMVYMLPYYRATMEFAETAGEFRFTSNREAPDPATFAATWRAGIALRDPEPESLAFFLVERYALFAGDARELVMTRVYHAPWALKEAQITSLESTMTTPFGIPLTNTPSLTHYSRTLHVEIWPPMEL